MTGACFSGDRYTRDRVNGAGDGGRATRIPCRPRMSLPDRETGIGVKPWDASIRRARLEYRSGLRWRPTTATMLIVIVPVPAPRHRESGLNPCYAASSLSPRGSGGSGAHSAPLTPRRWRLATLRRFLASSRRCREVAVGLVARRRRGVGQAFAIHAIRRATASSRFRSCVRKRRASIRRTPSSVSRLDAIRSSRSLTSGDSTEEFRTSKRSRTAVATLFTFCPPGPGPGRTRTGSRSGEMRKTDVCGSPLRAPPLQTKHVSSIPAISPVP